MEYKGVLGGLRRRECRRSGGLLEACWKPLTEGCVRKLDEEEYKEQGRVRECRWARQIGG